MNEIWRPVVGWESLYEVSSLGNVRSIRSSKLLRLSRRSDGYMTVGLHRGGNQQTGYVHRLVCEAFHGLPPTETHHAAHDNGVRDDNRPENILWKTPAANLADKVRHGTHSYGATHGCSQIEETDVLRVFEMRAAGYTLKAIAAQVGIHFSHVSEILNRHAWRHVQVPAYLLDAAQRTDGRSHRGTGS